MTLLVGRLLGVWNKLEHELFVWQNSGIQHCLMHLTFKGIVNKGTFHFQMGEPLFLPRHSIWRDNLARHCPMSALLFAALKSNLQVLIEFLVCAGCGVYYGQLDFNPQEKSENITTETKLLQYPCLRNSYSFCWCFFSLTNKTFKGKRIKFHWGVVYSTWS